MIKYLSGLGLRTRLILLVFIPIVPALLLLLYNASEQKRHGEEDIRKEAVTLAKLASNNIEQLMEGSHQVLSVLAELPAVQNYESAACNEHFTGARERLPMYNNILATMPNGDIFCSALPLKRKLNSADRQWFQLAVQSGRFSVGRYMIGRISGKQVINTGFPVYDKDGAMRAVISVSVDLQWFNDQLVKMQLGKGRTIFIIDREGTIIAHYPDAEKWVGRNMSGSGIVRSVLAQGEGTVETADLAGSNRIFSFTPVRGTDNGLYICSGILTEVAFADVYRTLLNNLVGLFIIAFIATAAAWIGGDHFFMRRMSKLANTTDELAGGNLKARVEVEGTDEISQLGFAFNNMASALEHSITGQKKTSDELRQSNQALVDEVAQRRQAEDALMKSHEQLRNLAAHLQSIRDEERTRISRELHDELGQVLTALKFDLSWLSGRIPPDNKTLMDKVQSDSNLVDSTIKILKRICADLRPSMLDHFGLGDALQWQAKQWEERSGIKCSVRLEPDDIYVDKDLAAALYGIFREALTNVRRHADARLVNVTLQEDEGHITLEINDDGVGISDDQLSKEDCFGLLGMRERVYPWKGTVTIEGQPDKGTAVKVTIPKPSN